MKNRDVCSACDGNKGWKDPDQNDPVEGYKMADWIKCPKCHGTGYVLSTRKYQKYEDEVSVKLISYTKPDENFLEDNDALVENDVGQLIAFCARVSNPGNQMNVETTDRLINFLLKHKHWSPFEMVDATVELTTTRDIGRQILRHRSFAFQEFSQRYADPTKDMIFVVREARLQDTKNRQNSIDISDNDTLIKDWERRQIEIIEFAKENYIWAVNNGLAKEQARVVLPEGLTMSRLYMKGSIRSWIHYLEVRMEQGTQKEHRMIAEMIAEVVSKIFPQLNNLIQGE